jgi:hypothetical protein
VCDITSNQVINDTCVLSAKCRNGNDGGIVERNVACSMLSRDQHLCRCSSSPNAGAKVDVFGVGLEDACSRAIPFCTEAPITLGTVSCTAPELTSQHISCAQKANCTRQVALNNDGSAYAQVEWQSQAACSMGFDGYWDCSCSFDTRRQLSSQIVAASDAEACKAIGPLCAVPESLNTMAEVTCDVVLDKVVVANECQIHGHCAQSATANGAPLTLGAKLNAVCQTREGVPGITCYCDGEGGTSKYEGLEGELSAVCDSVGAFCYANAVFKLNGQKLGVAVTAEYAPAAAASR